MSGNICDHIFTDGELFVWIVLLISKAVVGIALRELARKLGIANELPFDRVAEQMGPHSDLQCVINKFSIE